MEGFIHIREVRSILINYQSHAGVGSNMYMYLSLYLIPKCVFRSSPGLGCIWSQQEYKYFDNITSVLYSSEKVTGDLLHS